MFACFTHFILFSLVSWTQFSHFMQVCVKTSSPVHRKWFSLDWILFTCVKIFGEPAIAILQCPLSVHPPYIHLLPSIHILTFIYLDNGFSKTVMQNLMRLGKPITGLYKVLLMHIVWIFKIRSFHAPSGGTLNFSKNKDCWCMFDLKNRVIQQPLVFQFFYIGSFSALW